jgi:hypothetical protein
LKIYARFLRLYARDIALCSLILLYARQITYMTEQYYRARQNNLYQWRPVDDLQIIVNRCPSQSHPNFGMDPLKGEP